MTMEKGQWLIGTATARTGDRLCRISEIGRKEVAIAKNRFHGTEGLKVLRVTLRDSQTLRLKCNLLAVNKFM
jgi:hypothetical protein